MDAGNIEYSQYFSANMKRRKDSAITKNTHCIIDQCVLIAINEHSSNDLSTPVIGVIAGYWLADKVTVHITHFSPMARSPCSFFSGRVKEFPGDFNRSLSTFRDKGLTYLGRYSCHPADSRAIVAFTPTIEEEEQGDLLYLKLNCTSSQFISNHVPLFTISALNQKDQNIQYSFSHKIMHRPYFPPSLLKEMNLTLKLSAFEVERLYELNLKINRQNPNLNYLIECEYDRFCADLIKKSVVQANARVDTQYRNMASGKMNLKAMLHQRIDELKLLISKNSQEKSQKDIEAQIMKFVFKECQYSHSDYKPPTIGKYTATMMDFLNGSLSLYASKKSKPKPPSKRRFSVTKEDSALPNENGPSSFFMATSLAEVKSESIASDIGQPSPSIDNQNEAAVLKQEFSNEKFDEAEQLKSDKILLDSNEKAPLVHPEPVSPNIRENAESKEGAISSVSEEMAPLEDESESVDIISTAQEDTGSLPLIELPQLLPADECAPAHSNASSLEENAADKPL